MKLKSLIVGALLTGVLLGTPTLSIAHDDAMAPSQTVKVGTIEVSAAYSRATLPNAPVGAAYLTITNSGGEDDRLVSASSPIARITQLHEMKMVGDVMQMAELPNGIAIPAGQTVTLQPGGLHVMLMELKGPLTEGAQVALTLVFEKAGSVEITVPIGPYDAGHHAMAHGNGAGMGGDVSSLSDEDAIAQMQKAMFDKPDSKLEMGPIVVSGEYAISDWAQGGMGGRALLRKTEKGWGIHLCSGDGLKSAATLMSIGVPEGDAAQLAEKLAGAESGLDPAALKTYGSFEGTAMIDPSLIKAPS